jgi:DNA invertase Pin-like site-specific DNA recombinase
VVDELTHLNVEFVSFREQLDTGGPLGRAITVIIGAIAELERNLIIERVKAGLRRARLEGRRLGRPPLQVDRAALLRDRERGMTLTELAKAHHISRGSVSRVLRQAKNASQQAGTETCPQARLQPVESTEAEAAD